MKEKRQINRFNKTKTIFEMRKTKQQINSFTITMCLDLIESH